MNSGLMKHNISLGASDQLLLTGAITGDFYGEKCEKREKLFTEENNLSSKCTEMKVILGKCQALCLFLSLSNWIYAEDSSDF